jgi:hypothetical protein
MVLLLQSLFLSVFFNDAVNLLRLYSVGDRWMDEWTRSFGGITLTGWKLNNSAMNLSQWLFVHHKVSNSSLRDDGPATYRLSYGTTYLRWSQYFYRVRKRVHITEF